MNATATEDVLADMTESLRGIMRCAGTVLHREMEKYGVTWPQYHLLKVVRFYGDIPVTSLSNRLMITAPTASRMIDNLCSKGLLIKEKDSTDRRITRVRVSGEGEKLAKKMDARMRRALADIFEREDLRELEKLSMQLSRIADKWSNLEKETTNQER